MMTPELLHQAGAALYGAQYREPLRQQLDVGERILRRWLAGTAPIPDGIANDLGQMLEERRDKLDELINSMGNAK